MNDSSTLEKTWEDLLSREPDRISKAYQSLAPASQLVVLDHLRKMVSGTGWHPEQVKSANVALKALEKEI